MSEWFVNYGSGPSDPNAKVIIWFSGDDKPCMGDPEEAREFIWDIRGGKGDIAYYKIVEERDNVNTPSHYASGNLECIDAIREMLTKEQFKGMLAGNVTKYIWRKDYKGHPLTDLRKARWYLNRLIEEYENDNGN